MNSLLQFRDKGDENVTVQTNQSENLTALTQNTSSPDGCITVIFSELEFLPWDNPQNIISAEVETIVGQLKNNLAILLFLIGGPANVINMAVFYKQGLRDRVNLCLFALSLVDELSLVNFVIHHGEQVYIQFTTKEKFGLVSTTLTNINLGFLLGLYFVSYVLSAIIATERCLCIYHPLKFQSLLKAKTMAVIIIAVFIIVMGLFFVVVFRYRVGCAYDPVVDITVVTTVEGKFYKRHRHFIDPLASYVFGIGLPGAVFITVTVTTIMTVVKLRQVLKWRSQTTSSLSAQELAITKTLVVNSIFFIICMIPGAVNRISWLFVPEMNTGRRHQNLFLLALWVNDIFILINSTFNFFVYYIMGSRFRETFWALFGKKSQMKKRDQDLQNTAKVSGHSK